MLTGFRPTGPLHIGHWAGNVGNAVRLQDEGYECFYFVADWHMLTTHYDQTETLPARRRRAGARPARRRDRSRARSVVYRQSDLPEVAEMALLLGMITPLGWLERVPTYKERLRDMAERDIANFGLLGYPLLQTVDITIVQGTLVPVGEDQVSHLEISREIVRRFNRLYGDVLLEPQALLSEWPMIPGSDGRKMSKSLDNTIDLDDDPDTIRAKVRSFITDPQKVAARRPRPARDLPDLRLAPQVLSGHPGVDRRALPHGRARVRRLQDEPGRPHHRAARAVPRTTCGACRAARISSPTCSPRGRTRCVRSWRATMAAVRAAMHFA